MDRKTANQLADELIRSEKSASSKKRRHDSPRTNGEISIAYFILPVVLSSALTWIALISSAPAPLAMAIGVGVGIAASHLTIKHVI